VVPSGSEEFDELSTRPMVVWGLGFAVLTCMGAKIIARRSGAIGASIPGVETFSDLCRILADTFHQ